MPFTGFVQNARGSLALILVLLQIFAVVLAGLIFFDKAEQRGQRALLDRLLVEGNPGCVTLVTLTILAVLLTLLQVFGWTL